MKNINSEVHSLNRIIHLVEEIELFRTEYRLFSEEEGKRIYLDFIIFPSFSSYFCYLTTVDLFEGRVFRF